MYRPSNLHPSLETLYVDVDAYVAENPGLPQDSVRAAATIHNAALDLARGAGDFAASYEHVDAAVPYDPGPTAVAVDDITGALATAYGPADRPNAELVRDRLVRLAAIDPAHPLVAHWRILRDRCYPFAEAITDWPELEQYLTSRAVLEAGPQIGQACNFHPADGRAPIPGRVAHVWGPAMVSLEFTDDGGALATATSVPVVQSAVEGDRYCCVLLAA